MKRIYAPSVRVGDTIMYYSDGKREEVVVSSIERGIWTQSTGKPFKRTRIHFEDGRFSEYGPTTPIDRVKLNKKGE